jgi:hypothetical protein
MAKDPTVGSQPAIVLARVWTGCECECNRRLIRRRAAHVTEVPVGTYQSYENDVAVSPIIQTLIIQRRVQAYKYDDWATLIPPFCELSNSVQRLSLTFRRPLKRQNAALA